MPSRERSFHLWIGEGALTWHRSPPIVYDRDYVYGKHYILDYVDPGDGHDLVIEKYWFEGVRHANGPSPTYPDLVSCDDYPLSIMTGQIQPIELEIVGRPTNNQLASQLLAKTNPSRPHVDIPVAVGELVEIPLLIKSAGDQLSKRLASANIKWQFGVRPLVSDMMSLLNFTDVVGKRFVELKSLQEKGLRRTKFLWNGSNTSNDMVPTNRTPGIWIVDHWRRTVTKKVIWGHVKWFPSSNYPNTDAELLRVARRAVGGLTFDFSTAWELIPWSWLIDWYSNVGDKLKASRNLIPVTHSDPLIMEATVTEAHWTPKADNLGFDLEWTDFVTRKTRTSALGTYSASLPYLTVRQLSILGSLLILRTGYW